MRWSHLRLISIRPLPPQVVCENCCFHKLGQLASAIAVNPSPTSGVNVGYLRISLRSLSPDTNHLRA